MWPFKRNKSNQTPAAKPAKVPKEVEEFYQAERRERVGVAWLLALATLVTTVVVAFGLFFGGRWAYNKVTKGKSPVKVAIKETPSKPAAPAKPSKPSTSTNNTNNSKPQSSTPQGKVNAPTNPPKASTPAQTSQPSGSAPVKEDVSGDQENTDESESAPATTTTPPVASSTPSSSATPKTNGTNGKDLSNTGPGDTLAIFASVSLAAAIGHNIVTRRRLLRSN